MGKVSKVKATKVPSKRSCIICNEVDTEEMVQCDECDEFFHYTCVGVDASIVDKPWSCSTCIAELIPLANRRFNRSQSETLSVGDNRDNPTMLSLVRQSSLNAEANPNPPASNPPAVNASHATAASSSISSQVAESVVVKNLIQQLEDGQENQHIMMQEMVELRAKLEKSIAEREALAQQHESESIHSKSEISDLLKKVSELSDQLKNKSNRVIETPNPTFNDETLKRMEAILKRQEELSKRFQAERRSAHINIDLTHEDANNSVPREHQDSTLSDASRYSEVFDSGRRPEPAASSMDQFTATMNRKYLQELPTFDGDVKAWAFFEAVYNSTTLQGKYNEIDNVTRLRKALKPPASDRVQSLIMFSKSATAIMDELRTAYGKPEKLIAVLVQELLATPLITSQADPKLQDLEIKVKNFVANMIALNQRDELCNGYVVNAIVCKLDINHYKEWVKLKAQGNLDNKSANLEKLAEFLKEKVEEIPPHIISQASTSQPKTMTRGDKRQRVMTHVQANSSSKRSRLMSCFNCGENHPIYRCEDFKLMKVNDRRKLADDKKICSACLSSTQHLCEDCPNKRVCNLEGCTKFHHRLLHTQTNSSISSGSAIATATSQSSNLDIDSQIFNPSSQQLSAQRQVVISKEKSNFHHIQPLLHHNTFNNVLYKIVPVIVHGSDSRISTFALLDDGSSLTLVDAEITKKLNLSGTNEEILLQWTKSITCTEPAVCTSLTISCLNGRHHILKNVYAVKNLNLPKQSVDVKSLKEKYSHLRSLPISDVRNEKPNLLIGLRHAKFLLGNKTQIGDEGEPIASETELGWVVYGIDDSTMNIQSFNDERNPEVQLSIHQPMKSNEDLRNLVHPSFTTEHFGVMRPRRNSIGKEDNVAKVCDMCWQSFSNCFSCRLEKDHLVKDSLIKMIEIEFKPSKREILRTMMRRCDTLGLISMFLVRGKTVFTEEVPQNIETFRMMPHQSTETSKFNLEVLDEIVPRFQSIWFSLVHVSAFIIHFVKRVVPQKMSEEKFFVHAEIQQATDEIFSKIPADEFLRKISRLANYQEDEICDMSSSKLSKWFHKFLAAHVEDLSTENCVLSIRAFQPRRGRSTHLCCDNIMHRDLTVTDEKLCEDVARTSKICLLFIHIDFVMQTEIPNVYVFRSAMTEDKFWSNRRPLTEVPIALDDVKMLTPNSVLCGDDQDELAATIDDFDVNDAYSKRAPKRKQQIVNKVLKRWVKEYLPSICQRSKWNVSRNPAQGEEDDIIILFDPSETKLMWTKRRIIKVQPSTDGSVRADDVMLFNGTMKFSRFTGRLAVPDVWSSASSLASDGPGHVGEQI